MSDWIESMFNAVWKWGSNSRPTPEQKEQLMRVIRSHAPKTEWQPIETAPRDGPIEILGSPKWGRAKSPYYIDIAHWGKPYGFSNFEGWINQDGSIMFDGVTHWREFQPPQSAGSEPRKDV